MRVELIYVSLIAQRERALAVPVSSAFGAVGRTGTAARTIPHMRVTAGKVVEGKIVVEAGVHDEGAALIALPPTRGQHGAVDVFAQVNMKNET